MKEKRRWKLRLVDPLEKNFSLSNSKTLNKNTNTTESCKIRKWCHNTGSIAIKNINSWYSHYDLRVATGEIVSGTISVQRPFPCKTETVGVAVVATGSLISKKEKVGSAVSLMFVDEGLSPVELIGDNRECFIRGLSNNVVFSTTGATFDILEHSASETGLIPWLLAYSIMEGTDLTVAS